MGVYDQSVRYAAMTEPEFPLARLRPEIGLDLAFRGWFPTQSVPLPGGPDRDADFVMIADDPGAPRMAWLLVFEAQSSHVPSKLAVLHLEVAVFSCHALDTDRAGQHFLVLPVFIYLRGRCPEPVLSVRTPTGKGTQTDPVLWEVERDSAAATLAAVERDEWTSGALFWVPLMSGAEVEEVVRRWQRLLQEKVPELYRDDVRYVADQFAELAGCWPEWNRVLGEITVTESAIANRMIEQGELRAGRAALRRAIQFRFPLLMTPDVERAIADQPSLALLNEWNEAIFSVGTADEFLAVLRR